MANFYKRVWFFKKKLFFFDKDGLVNNCHKNRYLKELVSNAFEIQYPE